MNIKKQINPEKPQKEFWQLLCLLWVFFKYKFDVTGFNVAGWMLKLKFMCLVKIRIK